MGDSTNFYQRVISVALVRDSLYPDMLMGLEFRGTAYVRCFYYDAEMAL